MTDRVYLDWNAAAPLRPEARQAVHDALAVAGNPSSVHAEGRAARRLIEGAREQVAALLGISVPTVTRDLRFARAWVGKALAGEA